MSSGSPSTSPTKLGGQMSKGEILFCRQVRALIQRVLDARLAFPEAMLALMFDLVNLREKEYEVDSASESTWMMTVAIQVPPRDSVPPLSDSERVFLQDMDGLIDYAMRNGIDFLWILSAVAHDVGEIRAYEWNLEKTKKEQCFLPKVSGWAKRNTALIGEPEPETE